MVVYCTYRAIQVILKIKWKVMHVCIARQNHKTDVKRLEFRAPHLSLCYVFISEELETWRKMGEGQELYAN